jgi:uncharacterized protein involved in type VI secretion and phage assembly
MDSLPETLLHQLIDSAAQDVLTYKRAEGDPNRRAAGRAALESIDAAARALQTVRAALANELYAFDRPAADTTIKHGKGVPGNSGPGF